MLFGRRNKPKAKVRNITRQTTAPGGMPPEWAASIIKEGEMGPWSAQDKAEFYHASTEAQEWFLRLDADDVELLKWVMRAGYIVRQLIIWTVRGIGAFTVAFAGVFAFGEKLAKLPETILGAFSGISGTWHLLQGLFGS